MFEAYSNAYHAAGDGNYIATKNILENDGLDTYFHRHMYAASIHGGNPDVLEYIIRWGSIYGYRMVFDPKDPIMHLAMQNVIRTSNVILVAHLHQKRYFANNDHEMFMEKLCKIAVDNCNVNMIDYLQSMNYDVHYKTESVLMCAIQRNNVEMINYWFNNNSGLWTVSDKNYEELLDRSYQFAQLVHNVAAILTISDHIRNHFNGNSKRTFARTTLQHFGIDY